ncbi:MAG: methylenetetrahydrofolate reductase [Actinobacteria bacterium]|nr:methylenetetrahydrofolate reductase [Actinomycetota bacterium]
MAALGELLARARYEVLPLDGIADQVSEHVPPDVKITVTSSPRRGVETTLAVAEELAERGYEVAPHVAGRLVRGEEHLREIVERLRAARIRDMLVVGGDADEPAGPYSGAVALLPALAELDHGLEEIGITGYPESHPLISDEATIQAMFDKERYATYIVSQLCFDPDTIASWVARVRRRGTHLPIYLGIAGAVPMTKLVRVSSRIGVGESMRFASKNAGRFARLLLPGAYRPDRLVRQIAEATPEDAGIAGVHVYTFNELGSTEAWRQRLLARVAAARR